jgi:hypothetical protein
MQRPEIGRAVLSSLPGPATNDKRVLPYQLMITALLLLPAWALLFVHSENSTLVVLATNVIMLVGGFWLGASYGTQRKEGVASDKSSTK